MAGDLLYQFGCEILRFSAVFLGTCCKKGGTCRGVGVEKRIKEEETGEPLGSCD